MAQETKQQEKLPVLSDDVIEKRLQQELPGWWYEGRWIRRKYNTDGWLTTLALVNTIGYLAEAALRATLEAMAPPFTYEVAELPITVAALMTTTWIAKHLSPRDGVEQVLIPGLCEGDLRVIEDRLGVRAEKGPADLRELPEYFGGAALRQEYGGYDIRVFAEINNVPYLAREEVFRQAEYFQASGADVIDL